MHGGCEIQSLILANHLSLGNGFIKGKESTWSSHEGQAKPWLHLSECSCAVSHLSSRPRIAPESKEHAPAHTYTDKDTYKTKKITRHNFTPNLLTDKRLNEEK